MPLRVVATCLLLMVSPAICLNYATAQEEQGTEDQGGRRFRRGEGERGSRGGGEGRRGRQGGPGGQRGGFGGRGFGGFGGSPLLGNESVREELGIDEDQYEKLQAANEEMQAKRGELFQEMMAVRQEGGDMGGFRSKMLEMRSQQEDKVKAILSEAQYRRMKQAEIQLGLRIAGLGALAMGPASSELELTDDQQQQIRDELRARFVGQRGGGGPRGERGEGQQGNRERRVRPQVSALSLEEAREKAGEVLTEDQMKKLDEMIGREFELPEELLTMRGFGGRGFGGRQGGAGGPGGGRRERPQQPETESENEQ